jgi:hypothetical protein
VTDRRLDLLATLTLLAMTACWGSTFFLIHDLLTRVPTLDFLAVRFTIASATLVLLAPKALGRLTRESRRQAVVLGCLYGLAQILQTAGLAHTPASVSGFVTGMYVVATPLFAAVLLRNRITRLTWAAVLLAFAGLAVLTLDGFSIGYGEALTFVAAMLYALHIVGLGAWSTPADALGMSIVQILVIAFICLDTCHVFAAGAPLDEPGGATATVDRIVAIGGAGRLRLVHANDSMDVRGSFRDRHERIGDGHIGQDAFAEMFAHPATDGVPFVLETPGSRDLDDQQIPLLKLLREEADAQRDVRARAS